MFFDFDELDELFESRSSVASDVSSQAEQEPSAAHLENNTPLSVEVEQESNNSSVQRGSRAEDTEVANAASCSPCHEFLCFDATGILRGSCNECGNCSCWSGTDDLSDIRWYPRQRLSLPPRVTGNSCARCGCSSEKHETLESWLENVRDCIWRLRKTNIDTRRAPPTTLRLPAKAISWDVLDVALHVLTLGKYDCSIHRAPEFPIADDNVLVSVCVPTSTQRHDFHPLLYENFNRQKYQPKELVVVDIGTHPSYFLKEKALHDPRVIYRYFRASDATEDRREAGRKALRDQNNFSEIRVRLENWSLGLKRNLCCQLARGAVVAHFDDDDLYSPDYLGFMRDQLLDGIAERRSKEEASLARKGEYASIATLSQWHLMDMPDKIFRWMDPVTEEMPKEWRDPMIYGYGFSYIYTRAAWLLHTFPDVETSEDDKFMSNLRKSGVLVTLSQLPKELSGLVAHVSHSENTGLMEWNGRKRQGKVVEMPKAFEDLMPLINSLASKHPSRRAARPPPVIFQTTLGSRPGKGFGPRTHKGKGGKGSGKSFMSPKLMMSPSALRSMRSSLA